VADTKALSSLKRRLLSDGVWALGGRGVTILTAFAVNALLARLLSPQDLGAYFLAFSVVAVGAIAGALGLNQAAVRFLAESIALGQFKRARHALNVVSCLGGLGALGAGLAYLLFGDFLSTNLFQAHALTTVTGCIAGWIAAMSLQTVLAETFRGFHDIRLASIFNGPVAGVLLTACLILLWLFEGQAALAVVVVFAAGSVFLSSLFAGWALRRKAISLPSEGSGGSIGLGTVLRVALPLMTANLTFFGLTQADIWTLGTFRSEAEVAIYGAASRLAVALLLATQVLYAVLPPLIVEKHTRNEKENLERLLRGGATISSIVVAPLFLAFIVVPNLMLRFVYGAYYEDGRWILMILAVGIFVNVLTGLRGYVLMLTGYERTQLMISLVGGAANIALCILGAIYWGIYGVALAAMTTMVLQSLVELIVVRYRLGIWTHSSIKSLRDIPSSVRFGR
jgi:O-antigen/teichoic acid export membrane protein